MQNCNTEQFSTKAKLHFIIIMEKVDLIWHMILNE